jgi:aspartyl-tRNA(Asn)/glutamyl-tRNA(Gln) amidotransferase subunit A
MAPQREDARLYRYGAALERLLEQQWGAPLIDSIPDLDQSQQSAAQEGVI